jgi:hypothetical protein
MTARSGALDRFRKARVAGRLGALAGILAIALHSLMSIALPPLVVAAAFALEDGANPTGFPRAAFCLSDARLTDRQAPSKPESHHGLAACVLCQAVPQVALVLPPTPAPLPMSSDGVATTSVAPADIDPARATMGGIQPRAPPVSA